MDKGNYMDDGLKEMKKLVSFVLIIFQKGVISLILLIRYSNSKRRWCQMVEKDSDVCSGWNKFL